MLNPTERPAVKETAETPPAEPYWKEPHGKLILQVPSTPARSFFSPLQ